jgi:hypothetical protein
MLTGQENCGRITGFGRYGTMESERAASPPLLGRHRFKKKGKTRCVLPFAPCALCPTPFFDY